MMKKHSYESPIKKKKIAQKTITLEENYSQTKNHQNGNLESIKRERRQDLLKPTPSKYNGDSSAESSMQK